MHQRLTLDLLRMKIHEASPSLVILSGQDAQELADGCGVQSIHGLYVDRVPIASTRDVIHSWIVTVTMDGDPILNPWR